MPRIVNRLSAPETAPMLVGDVHICAFPLPPGHPPNAIASGSVTVRIGGRPAARVEGEQHLVPDHRDEVRRE
jgi:uncharacterized Zn-binding protein involved in type VI secretion